MIVFEATTIDEFKAELLLLLARIEHRYQTDAFAAKPLERKILLGKAIAIQSLGYLIQNSKTSNEPLQETSSNGDTK
jgi:hypothetical protein